MTGISLEQTAKLNFVFFKNRDLKKLHYYMLLLFLFDIKKTQQNNQNLRTLVSLPMRREDKSNEPFLVNGQTLVPILCVLTCKRKHQNMLQRNPIVSYVCIYIYMCIYICK